MTNKSGAIGTRTETAIVRHAHEHACSSCGKVRSLPRAPAPGRMCRSCGALVASRAAAAQKRPSEFDRIMAKVNKQPGDGCWLWTAYIAPNGYGMVRFRGRNTTAHRAVYRLFREADIPEGMELDHLCRVRSCVNPNHLEVVTPKVNTHRGFSPSGINSRKTHCRHGHEYTAENTYVERAASGRSKRHCRTCIAGGRK